MALGIILGNWLLLTGIGSWLGRTTGRLENPRSILVAGLIFVAVVPLAQVFLLRAFHNIVFIRGATVGITGTVAGSFVLLLPFCVVSGYLLTLACSILASGEGPSAIGRVYIADSIGSVIGGVVFSFVLIRFFDHFGILCFPALLNLALAGVAAFFSGAGFSLPRLQRWQSVLLLWFCAATRMPFPQRWNIRGRKSCSGRTRPTASSWSPNPPGSSPSSKTACLSSRRTMSGKSRKRCITRWHSGLTRARFCLYPVASREPQKRFSIRHRTDYLRRTRSAHRRGGAQVSAWESRRPAHPGGQHRWAALHQANERAIRRGDRGCA